MKKLLQIGLLLSLSVVFSSCGLPLAALRTVKNSPQTVDNVLTGNY